MGKHLTCNGCQRHVSPLKQVGELWLCKSCRKEREG